MERAINQELGEKMWKKTGAEKLQQDGCFLIQWRTAGFDFEAGTTVCSRIALLISYTFSHTRLYKCTHTCTHPSFFSRIEGAYLFLCQGKRHQLIVQNDLQKGWGASTICTSGFFQFTWNNVAHTASYRMWRWSCFPLAWPEVKQLFSSSSSSFLANTTSFSEIFHADNG